MTLDHDTLREAIRRIEALHGNEKYQQAWRRAADTLRDMIVQSTVSVPDKHEQISISSSRPV
ncbi:hypothetical protein [Bradyrhizobium elkanii]|uniref:hypothetical protein n=1 Tax=Bradyrhizobium elkanii TaxID=29448 RepID=UPI0014495A42|nr:hypothetical protein [Bradyrhizobium elkanii]MCP1932526.1 hypothetical protein [Bradyrhizobium elkanii]MCS3479547.1 hypothetical protein [Bradyrhizobium elkanii]MCS3576932.1 hypothetical protein [Bradyrhizobium elkanii]MCS3719809.1 hypothetical protein [Bradyrhizobium elkanii]MCS4004226.1 hypothetical protein [Bradyrhizobium elkanii USDA 61]